MFLPQKALNGRHLATQLYKQGMKRKWRHLMGEEAWKGTERALTAYGVLLSLVTSFKYLG